MYPLDPPLVKTLDNETLGGPQQIVFLAYHKSKLSTELSPLSNRGYPVSGSIIQCLYQGRIQRARAPLKLEKIRFFCRKIGIFHTKYPKNFRASLRSMQFF
jgi:hypothetical protein